LNEVKLPQALNSHGIQVLSPVGAAATAQTIDNTKVYSFLIPEGTFIRCAAAQDLYVRTGHSETAAPTLSDLQSTGYVKSGAAIVLRSQGVVWVCSGSATTLTWAPDKLAGTESD
jgi:hypothetical protein